MDSPLEWVGLYVRVFLEPPLCIGYLLVMLAIARSRNAALHTPFFLICHTTGIAGMATMVGCGLIHLYRDQRVSDDFAWLIYTAHVIYDASSISHMLGFLLMALDRLSLLCRPTVIVKPPSWKLTIIVVVVQFALPLLLQLHYFREDIVWRVDPSDGRRRVNGYGMTKQQALISRSIFAVLCSIYVILNIVLNGVTVFLLRKAAERRSPGCSSSPSRQQRRLHYFAIMTSLIYLLNACHQLVWCVAAFLGNFGLLLFVVQQIFWILPLTVFVSPAMMLAMSSTVRTALWEQFARCTKQPAERSTPPRVVRVVQLGERLAA